MKGDTEKTERSRANMFKESSLAPGANADRTEVATVAI